MPVDQQQIRQQRHDAIKDVPGIAQNISPPFKRKRTINKSSPALQSSPTDTKIIPFDIDGFRKQPDRIMLMVLPRPSRRAHFKGFSSAEEGLFVHKINNRLVSDYYSIENDHEKFDFITNVIITWQYSYRIIKLHEDSEVYYEVSTKDLYTLIQNRLRKAKQPKTKMHDGTCFQSFSTTLSSTSIYNTKDLLPTEDIEGRSYLSILHSLYSSFSFYVYAYSHRVRQGFQHPVHACTKLKLNFPSYPNLFILFH